MSSQGTLINIVGISLLLYSTTIYSPSVTKYFDIDWLQTITFATLISAVDPVAVGDTSRAISCEI